MKLAYMQSNQRGAVNRVLADLASALLAEGWQLAGTTQVDTPRSNSRHCDMDVQVLPLGEVIRISEFRGENARGCRLDPEALEQAVAQTLARLDSAEMLVINKFGKHEADGRGFREVIAAAMARGIPVIVGTNGLNLEAFLEFTDHAAEALPADLDRLLQWAGAARRAA